MFVHRSELPIKTIGKVDVLAEIQDFHLILDVLAGIDVLHGETHFFARVAVQNPRNANEVGVDLEVEGVG